MHATVRLQRYGSSHVQRLERAIKVLSVKLRPMPDVLGLAVRVRLHVGERLPERKMPRHRLYESDQRLGRRVVYEIFS